MIFRILSLCFLADFLVHHMRHLLSPHGHSWGLTMRKCAPGGAECVLTFKPVALIDASGLDEAQVTHFCAFALCFRSPCGRNDPLLCGAVFSLVRRLRCLFSLLLWFHRFVYVAFPCFTLSHFTVYPMYIWFRDRWQLPQGAQVTKKGGECWTVC